MSGHCRKLGFSRGHRSVEGMSGDGYAPAFLGRSPLPFVTIKTHCFVESRGGSLGSR